MLGSAERQVPRLISREIIFEEVACDLNPPTSQTDGWTDRQLTTTIPRSAMLRAVKGKV